MNFLPSSSEPACYAVAKVTGSRNRRNTVRKQRILWTIGMGCVFALIALAAGHPAAGLTQEATADTAAPESAIVEDTRYAAYGFLFEQYSEHERFGYFTEREIEALGVVIEAFAEQVGGAARLHTLVDGPYYTWGAESGDELAQIVFGHEIGHRWLETLRRDSGTDWGVRYAQNVWRGERPSQIDAWDLSTASSVSPEEEAVTNLALAVLGKRQRWTFLHDAPAKDQRQVYIDGWVSDVMAASEPA